MSGLIGNIFKSPVFTWWNSATFGTRWFTRRRGEKVGEDDQGNIYYKERDGGKRRWVIYKNGPVEASRVPPEWHAWLHRTVDVPPSEQPPETKSWEKPHIPNLTGSAEAYIPGGHLQAGGKRQATASDYEAWSPE